MELTYQIGEEEQIVVQQIGRGEIAPDTALDYGYQQQGQSGGLEGEQQHDDHEEHREHADYHIVLLKGAAQVIAVGGVPHHIVFLILPGHDAVDDVQILVALLPLRGQVQQDHHAAVTVAHELELCVAELLLQVVQHIHRLLIQVQHHFLALLKEIAEHVYQRHPVILQVGGYLAVVALVHGIAGVQQLRHLYVQVRHLGKLLGVRAEVRV